MKQKIILLDMDDVLCDLVKPWLKKLSTQFKINVIKADIISWDIGAIVSTKFPKIKKEQVYDCLREVGFFEQLPIMPNARETIEKIQELGWRIVIVTSLPTIEHNSGQVVQEKLTWLDKHLRGLIKDRDVIFTYQKNLIAGDVLIDDAPHNLEIFPHKTIAFSQPWNQLVDTDARVNNWNEVIKTCSLLLGENK